MTQEVPRTNQRREEPIPASPEEEPDQLAVRRNEELGSQGAGTALPTPSPSPLPDAVPAVDAPADAPAVQAVRADSEDGEVERVTETSNAVPGRPDGEVDPRVEPPHEVP
ncbi:MAG: hypothetical protein GEV11_03575 [Streptosporangiales bacterium]|nr:hypothetical protein [Streptosporangiales bacterium]